MSSPEYSASTAAEMDEDIPCYETCRCLIMPDRVPLPLGSRVPDASDPILPGECIYHHRLHTRDAETAIFIDLASEIDELKEVLSTGMVKFTPQKQTQGSHPGSGLSAGAASLVLRKSATSTEMHEATSNLKLLIADRDRQVARLWAGFVDRWGGKVVRRDDGTMFVLDEGMKVKQEQQGGNVGKEGNDGSDDDARGPGENDPYVQRMKEVQARMDGLGR